MKLYMCIDTSDDLELPLAVADSVAELARLLRVSVANIYVALKNARLKGIRSKYVVVDLDDDYIDYHEGHGRIQEDTDNRKD